MKELKLRAFHIKEKKMCKVTLINFDKGAFLEGINPGEDQVDGKYFVPAPENGRFCDFEEFILMQFLGITDRNGKEIWDGDVVKRMEKDYSDCQDWKDNDPRWDNAELKEVMRDVATMEYFPGFWLKNESFGYEGEDLETPEHCEIIGNIHENPELI